MSRTLLVDPTLRIALRVPLALLLVWAAGHKLRDIGAFRSALGDYELLPARWLEPVTVGLIATELILAAGLLLPVFGAAPALGVAGLMSLYGAAISINLWRGRRDIDCGCAGPAGRQSLSGALVVRNAVLAGAALVCAWPPAPRLMTWVDALTILAGSIALALLYAATGGLIAQAPRSAALVHPRVSHPRRNGQDVVHA